MDKIRDMLGHFVANWINTFVPRGERSSIFGIDVITQFIAFNGNWSNAYPFKKYICNLTLYYPHFILAFLKKAKNDIIGQATIFCGMTNKMMAIVDAYTVERCKPQKTIFILENRLDVIAYQTIVSRINTIWFLLTESCWPEKKNSKNCYCTTKSTAR